MPIGLESHGLPALAPYGAPVTVQDQGQGQQQHQTPEAGFSPASAFEAAPGASVAHAVAQPEADAAGGDLLSKLSGFIKAVGDVVVKLGEFIRTAGGALDGADGEPQTQAQTGAGAGAGTPAAQAGQAAPAANAQVQVQQPAPQVAAPGTPAPQPQLAGAPAQPSSYAVAVPTQTRLPAQGATTELRGGATPARSTPTQRGASSQSPSGTDLVSASLNLAASIRGGARSASGSSLPVLNPLPSYLGNEIGALPEFLEASNEVTLSEPGSPEAAAAEAGAAQAVAAEQASQPSEQPALPSNVIPIRRAATTQSPATAPEPLQTDSSNLGYSAIVFRPAFYGNLRC